ncbi:TonB-dependent receptor [Dasania sp. GY-MA-18]|uniref:TonB-dependent receptor n=1 Tax=Dasania phycosphaerae TaxID=2950436 RepID=A0A9J6RL44_9GAMM|nr:MULTISPECIES: TonB-dependent receptor [Dasania]MCR8922789.1 TonB-dependent receptor [Dasania sp. GY-MA-18]MCZ0865219.1 TonB-dependent receptor [Dasania phycosphaerae]MCZ0868945.1 TonB-dependent receptor [Dasania phycosphaerae]
MNKQSTAFRLKTLAFAVAAAMPASDVMAAAMLEEVMVTATKRSASAQDVPINLSVTSGNELSGNGIVGLEKFVRTVPGITRVDSGARNVSPMAIRGLSVDGLSANDAGGYGGTVSTYVGDTPLLLDMKMKDLERIEVLRGPQGTLYGAGAMGGTIRYVLNKPDTAEFAAKVSTSLSSTKESDGISSDTDFMVNLPLLDEQLALRVVGGHVDKKGFVDADHIIAGAAEDVDNERTDFARVAVLWAPTADLDITATYFMQDQYVGGRQAVTPDFTGDKYGSGTRFKEAMERNSDLYTLELNWELDFASLTSSSSYYEITEQDEKDQTDLLTVGLGLDFYLDYPEFSALAPTSDERDAFTQELRLTSNSDGDIDWVVGVYYSNESHSYLAQEYVPGYPAWAGIDRPDELEYNESYNEDITEKAVFGEVTYHVNESWQITAGLRSFELETDTDTCIVFPVYFAEIGEPGWAGTALPISQNDHCSVGGGDNKDTFFKLNTSYDLDDDKMVYFTWAEGFRRGGANGIPAGGQVDFPESYKSYDPDTVTNWEVGAKSEWLESRLQVNGALYYIEWEGVQLSTVTPEGGIPVTINGDDARSQGVELEVKALPTDDLTITFNAAYTDAELTEDTLSTPEIDGQKGDSLPGIPKTTYALALDYFWFLDNGYELTAHVDSFYKAKMDSQLNDNQINQLDPSLGASVNRDNVTLDSHMITNASLTLRGDQWSARLFADNITNEYAYTGIRSFERYGEQGGFYYLTRPRTVGIALSYDF